MHESYRDVMVATCLPIDGGYEIDIAEAVAPRHALSISL